MLASRAVSRGIIASSLRATSQCHSFSTDLIPDEKKMDYRLLGNTGLKVSLFSFGFFATYGVKEGIDRALSILEICRKNGINFYDNAEVYGKNRGDAEKIMGDAMSILKSNNPTDWRRSDLVISSKVFWGGDGQNEKGTKLNTSILFLHLQIGNILQNTQNMYKYIIINQAYQESI